MSTSTHWTNSSHTPSPVLFLTDQHNASQTLINTKGGWSGGAKVLGKLSVPGRPTG